MPISKTPLEYYRYYCASQRRVEQWVQDTGQSLQGPPSDSTPQWRGFLEDPCLLTPISLPHPLDSRKSRESEKEHTDTPDHNSGHNEGDVQADLDKDTSNSGIKQRRRSPSSTVTKKGSHESGRPQDSCPSDMRLDKKADLTAGPSSSKHSKESRNTRHTSKTQHSSSCRKRQSRKESSDNVKPSLLVYIPYGIIALILAMTTGSSSVSLAAASIMLAGYFCLDYTRDTGRKA